MKKCLPLFIMVLCIALSKISLAQDFDNPGKYMEVISKQQENVSKRYMSYKSASAHGKREKKVENLQGFHGKGGVADANRIGRHYGFDCSREQVFVRGHLTPEIAIGENADEFVARVHDREATGLGFGHHEQGFFDGQIFVGDCIAFASAHDFADA